MNKQLATIAFAGLIGASTVWAGEVGTVTTFSSGSPALASEVNSNFQALITAINDNATRIAELESAGADNSVAGHTYSLFYAGTFFAAEVDTDGSPGDTTDSRDYTTAEHYAGQGSFTFDSVNLTGSGTAGDTGGAELFVGSGGSIGWDGSGAEPQEALTFTWSQSGNAVTVDIEGESETLNFVVSEDGSLLAGQGTDSGIDNRDDGSNADFSDISTIILIRN